jgi:oleate hydratase
MKAHIVGGGFGGLAAAALLIRDAKVPGPDITIYEAEDKLGGGFFLDGDPEHGYNLPGSIFDKEFRCAFDLLATIPTQAYPNISVKEQFFTFNNERPFVDQVHIVDRDLRPVQAPRYGLSLDDGLALAKLSLTPEASLDGQRIEEFFSPEFFKTEFWLLWSTLMGSLPQHSLIEFRRYMNRFVYLFPDLSTMAHVLRSQFNQHEAFVKPLVAWLEKGGANFIKGAFVHDIGFAEARQRMTVNRLDYERGGETFSVAVAPEDIALVTTGSQAADRSAGTMDTPPPGPPRPGRSWALWRRLAAAHKGFGNPDVFFGPDRIKDSRWVTFTVTTTGKEFLDQMTALTRSDPGSGGLLTLKDSNWVLSLSIFAQPEVLEQPPGTSVWWGYGLYPERNGNYFDKPMYQCTGREILEELLRHLRFNDAAAIMKSSICIPCDMPYVNNIWLPRKSGDRPPVVPEGATNLGLIGQYVELERDIAFTFEYSTRSAWEAIYRLTKRGPPPPDVYQGQYDPKGVWTADSVFLDLSIPFAFLLFGIFMAVTVLLVGLYSVGFLGPLAAAVFTVLLAIAAALSSLDLLKPKQRQQLVAGAVAGGGVVIGIWILESILHITVPREIYAAMITVVPTVVSFLAESSMDKSKPES